MIKKGLAVAVILLFIGLAFAPSINAIKQYNHNFEHNENLSPIIYRRHRAISINGNDDFTRRHGVIRGDGTEENPYIISGWRFNGRFQYTIDTIRWKTFGILITLLFGDVESAISIKNTDKHLVIRRNDFVRWKEPTPPYSPYGSSRPNHRAITLNSVKNVTIEDNIIRDCNEGILCRFSNTTIIGNEITAIHGGISCIHFLDSNEHTMTYIQDNILLDSEGYTIIGEYGVIENNILDNCDIAIKTGNSRIKYNLVLSSTIGIAVAGPNCYIANNNLMQNNVGIGCYWPPSNNPIIVDNIINGNNWGIFCIGNSQPSIHYNNIYGNYLDYNLE